MKDLRLCLETSSEICSIALYSGINLLVLRETEKERSHASLITLFIDEILKSQGLKVSDLSYVIVSSGPGSYTGLRVGYSTAKGLCYAYDIPLIAVSSLASLAYGLKRKHLPVKGLYCPIIDARRMEVYAALYDYEGNELMAPEAIILDETFNDRMSSYGDSIIYGGSGAEKLKESFNTDSAQYDTEIVHSSRFLMESAERKILKNDKESLAYSEPYYLKSVYIKS